MTRQFFAFIALFVCTISATPALGQQPSFHVLAFYTTKTEPDHVEFAEGALKFFGAIAAKDRFTFEATTNWDDLNSSNLGKYQLIVWLNDFPNKPEQRQAFQTYMEAGGAWLGFHVAAYNDADTHWPWFVDFLGGGVFDINSWPTLPAKLTVDDRTHAATRNLPESYVSPANEWYIWKPSPRLNRDVRVLVTLDPSNYPLGLKNVLTSGDLPVVWTNTKYNMIYMNMGHGDKIFTSPTQNKLFEDAMVSLGARTERSASPAATGVEVSPRAVVVNPKTNKAYAVNTPGGAVTVIDGMHHTTTSVKVGTDPEAIAVNAETNKIYVGNTGSGTVTVIDGTTNAVIETVKVGDLPYVVAVNPATNKVYVSRTFSNTMTVIDGASNVTSSLKAGVQADAIAVNPITNKMYLINYEGSDITVIGGSKIGGSKIGGSKIGGSKVDGASDAFTKVVIGTHLWGIAVNSVTNKIYLTNTGASSVAVLDGATNVVTSVNTGEIPCAVAVDTATNRIYVANYASDSVTVIDGATNTVIATVKVGSRPQALAVNSETHKIFVANTHSNNVTVIDGTNNSVAATVNAGKSPYAIAVDAVNNKAYVAGIAADNLVVIDGSTLKAVPAAGPTGR